MAFLSISVNNKSKVQRRKSQFFFSKLMIYFTCLRRVQANAVVYFDNLPCLPIFNIDKFSRLS